MAVDIKRVGKSLQVKLPLEKPTTSKSGKTMLVATTHGVIKTKINHAGKPIYFVLNAFIYPSRDGSPEMPGKSTDPKKGKRKKATNVSGGEAK